MGAYKNKFKSYKPSPQHVIIDYTSYTGKSAIIEADYNSYISLTGNKAHSKYVKLKTSATTGIAVYLTSSRIYASNFTVQGKNKKGIGLLLNRMSHGRLMGHAGQSLSWFYGLETGIYSQNGSSVQLSGPIRIKYNTVGLHAASGADIKYSYDVLVNGNNQNFKRSAILKTLKAY